MIEYKVFPESRSFSELQQEAKTTIIRPKDLTIEDFFQLWIVEEKSDREIAEVIGALEKTISNRRQKLKVNSFVRLCYKMSGPLEAIHLLSDFQDRVK